MREAFGDEYYGAEDPDEEFQGHDVDYSEKPDFDAEDELLGLPKGWDGRKVDGFHAAREKAKAGRRSDAKAVEDGAGEDEADEDEDADEGAEEDEDEGAEQDEADEDEDEGVEQDEADEDEDEDEEGAIITESGAAGADDGDDVEGVGDDPEETRSRKKRKGRVSLREKLAFDKQLEEYYKLDYEDVVGDLRTRFKYREVLSNTYGLSTEEILITDDKELNQYVSLKKLAPYRTEEWKPPKHHRFSQKKRKRLALQDGVSDHTERLKKFKSEGRSKYGGLNHTKGQKKSKSKGRCEETCAPNSNDQERKHTEETNGAVASTSKKHDKRHRKPGPVIPMSRLIAYGKVPFRMKKTKK
jgi:protein KRI1